MTLPKFDCIDFENPAPEGYAYAYGFDLVGTSYYGLVEVSEDGLIGNYLAAACIPYQFELSGGFIEDYKNNFLDVFINTLKQAV